MIRRPPRSTRTDTLFPTRRSSDRWREGVPGFHPRAERRWRPQFAPEEGQSDHPIERRAGAPRQLPVSDCCQRGNPRLLHHTGKTGGTRSEEHTSELQSLMRISYAFFCLKTKIYKKTNTTQD